VCWVRAPSFYATETGMKITRGPVRRCRLTRTFSGKPLLLLDGARFELSDINLRLSCLNKETRKSLPLMFLMFLLAMTIVGLIVAIPLWIASGCGTRVSATIQIDTPEVRGLIATVNNKEWNVISKYLS
jgi:hypothetical protein